MPPAVLGGLALMLFGFVSVAGLRLIAQAGLTHRNALIIAIAVGVGIGAPSQAEWLGTLPGLVRSLLESGVSAGGITALALNYFLPGWQEAPIALGTE